MNGTERKNDWQEVTEDYNNGLLTDEEVWEFIDAAHAAVEMVPVGLQHSPIKVESNEAA